MMFNERNEKNDNKYGERTYEYESEKETLVEAI